MVHVWWGEGGKSEVEMDSEGPLALTVSASGLSESPNPYIILTTANGVPTSLPCQRPGLQLGVAWQLLASVYHRRSSG